MLIVSLYTRAARWSAAVVRVTAMHRGDRCSSALLSAARVIPEDLALSVGDEAGVDWRGARVTASGGGVVREASRAPMLRNETSVAVRGVLALAAHSRKEVIIAV